MPSGKGGIHPISKNRHGRFRDSDLFRRLFENVVARCIAEGLVGGERFAVDASIIRADANKQNATPIGEWPAEKLDPANAPRAVREYLDTLDDAAFGAASEKTPKFTAHADPAAQWTGALSRLMAQWTEFLTGAGNGQVVQLADHRA